MTSTIEQHSDAALTLLDAMSEVCEQEYSAGWIKNACTRVRAEGFKKIRDLETQAQGLWVDVPTEEEDDTSHRYIPNVHFIYFDECQNCHKRKSFHLDDGKCPFEATQYLPRDLHL